MSVYLRSERIQRAVLNIHDWRSTVQAQASSHLVSVLSLLRKGVNTRNWTKYEEDDDFAFYDEYFKLGNSVSHPYFDPLTRNLRIASHPHSNVATARKGTFANSWNAGESVTAENGETQWKLAAEFADLISQRVLKKGGEIHRANVIDWACWFFRKASFEDTATASVLADRFRTEFRIAQQDFEKLFVFHDEPRESLFGPNTLSQTEENSILGNCLISGDPVVPLPPQVVATEVSSLPEDHSIWQEVSALLEMRTSGIILNGPPGTGKSWLAQQIALKLANGNLDQIERVQFHSSLGYEDFIEGFSPSEDTASGFTIKAKTFLNFAAKAAARTSLHIMIIDEINRGDPSRVFGDLLTYMEAGWRDIEFRSPFRNLLIKIPKNLLILATMNPHDRSVTTLDMAMLRRFDHINIPPSIEIAEQLLATAGFETAKIGYILGWFDQLQNLLPFGIGHTYFLHIGSLDSLRKVYRYRIEPFCRSVLEYDPDRLTGIHSSFQALENRLTQTEGSTT